MKNSVIVLLVVALIVLVIGAVNQDQRVDLDYVFGTWRDVSVFTLTAIVAAATMVVGFVVAAMARLGVVGEKRKLERELEQVYPRLREAERAAGLPEWHPEPATVVPGALPGGAATDGESPVESSGASPAADTATADSSPGGEAAETSAGPELTADADVPPLSGPPPAVPAGSGAAPRAVSPAAGAAGESGASEGPSAAATDEEGPGEPPASSAG